jgi:hypothetical protein
MGLTSIPNLFGRQGTAKAMNEGSQRISDDLGEFQARDFNQFLKYLPARQ